MCGLGVCVYVGVCVGVCMEKILKLALLNVFAPISNNLFLS